MQSMSALLLSHSLAPITLERSSRLLRLVVNDHTQPGLKQWSHLNFGLCCVLPPFLPVPPKPSTIHSCYSSQHSIIFILSSFHVVIQMVTFARNVFSFPDFSIIEAQFKWPPAWSLPTNLHLPLLICLTHADLWFCLFVDCVFSLLYNLDLAEAYSSLAMKYEMNRCTYRY